MQPFLLPALFIFGVIIGSFLNVVLLRLHTGRGIGGRSACLSCGVGLRPLELVPVLSFLVLRGKCAHCKTRISSRYLLVELGTGFLFAAVGALVGASLAGLILLPIVALLVLIVAYDVMHTIVPDRFVYPLIVLAGLFASLHPGETSLRLLAGVAAGGFFALLWFASNGKVMGLGDAKLALAIGLLVEPALVLPAFLLAFWSGSIVGIALVVKGRLSGTGAGFTMKSEMPFAPFLIVGCLVALLAPELTRAMFSPLL